MHNSTRGPRGTAASRPVRQLPNTTCLLAYVRLARVASPEADTTRRFTPPQGQHAHRQWRTRGASPRRRHTHTHAARAQTLQSTETNVHCEKEAEKYGGPTWGAGPVVGDHRADARKPEEQQQRRVAREKEQVREHLHEQRLGASHRIPSSDAVASFRESLKRERH